MIEHVTAEADATAGLTARFEDQAARIQSAVARPGPGRPRRRAARRVLPRRSQPQRRRAHQGRRDRAADDPRRRADHRGARGRRRRRPARRRRRDLRRAGPRRRPRRRRGAGRRAGRDQRRDVAARIERAYAPNAKGRPDARVLAAAEALRGAHASALKRKAMRRTSSPPKIREDRAILLGDGRLRRRPPAGPAAFPHVLPPLSHPAWRAARARPHGPRARHRRGRRAGAQGARGAHRSPRPPASSAPRHWGRTACDGQVAITWEHLGARTNAESRWSSPAGGDPSTYMHCTIAYSLDVRWDWPKFCIGHRARAGPPQRAGRTSTTTPTSCRRSTSRRRPSARRPRCPPAHRSPSRRRAAAPAPLRRAGRATAPGAPASS